MLKSGQKLTHYEVLALLGKGGMGEVYLARDTKLDREVAIKVLPAKFLEDFERVARFEREAKILATLNHPNVAQIFGIDQEGDVDFIAMELVQGEDLATRLGRGALSVDEVVDLCGQIAEGLATAHDAGIVHRDLKPANVRISNAGEAKLLDFGLAKPLHPSAHWADGDVPSEAESAGLTEDGMLLGTPTYMSPEQIRGQPLDRRSDIWAFGCVVFECLAGSRAFTAHSVPELLSAVLNNPPAWSKLPADLPQHLRLLLERTLVKDPRQRLRDLGDARWELESGDVRFTPTNSSAAEVEATKLLDRDQGKISPSAPTERLEATPANISEGGDSESDDSRDSTARRTARDTPQPETPLHTNKALLAITLIVLTAYFTTKFTINDAALPTSGALDEHVFSRLTDRERREDHPTIAPSGNFVVYSAHELDADWDIFLQRVGGTTAANLTEDSSAHDFAPALSPDATSIAFRSEREGGGLFLMGATGESPRRLTDFGEDPAWSPDGTCIAFATGRSTSPHVRLGTSDLHVLTLETGEIHDLGLPDAMQPSWSPDGRWLAYWAVDSSGRRDIYVVPAEGGAAVRVLNDAATDWCPTWVAGSSDLVFSSDRSGELNLWRLSLDPETGAALHAPRALTSGVGASLGSPSFSADGKRFAFTSNSVEGQLARLPFDVERGVVSGPLQRLRGTRFAVDASLSPDGERLAFHRAGARENLFSVHVDGTVSRQLTDESAKDRDPSWSADGDRLFFFSDRSGTAQVWSCARDGSDLRQHTALEQPVIGPLPAPTGTRFAATVVPDGPQIFDSALAPAEQEPEALDIPPLAGGQIALSDWSRDGRWIALWGGEAGSLSSYRYDRETHESQLISAAGSRPKFLADSATLVFVTGDQKLGYWDATFREERVIFSSPTDQVVGVEPSADGAWLYIELLSVDTDVWIGDAVPESP